MWESYYPKTPSTLEAPFDMWRTLFAKDKREWVDAQGASLPLDTGTEGRLPSSSGAATLAVEDTSPEDELLLTQSRSACEELAGTWMQEFEG